MNIGIVSMDCVRPDYLAHPFFESLRRDSLCFETAVAQASHTSTSHVSMLTGLYPFHHGVRWLIGFHVEGTLLQERLKAAGFATAAFLGGYPLPRGDLARGFDLFRQDGLIDDLHEGRGRFVPANVLVAQALEWLGERRGQDTFVFIHCFDAHLTLRSEFVGGTRPEKDEQGVYKDIERHLGRRERRYREETDFLGTQLALLRDAADWDLLVVTADHGEKMHGAHDYPWVHNAQGERISSHFHEAELYDVQLRVPLFFWGPAWPAERVEPQVRSIDIVPTILAWLGLDPGDGPLDGVNLLGRDYPQQAYSETYFAQLAEANRHAAAMHERYAWGWTGVDSLVSLRTNAHKLICLANGAIQPHKLFDLQADPGESTNAIDRDPDAARQLLDHLADLLADEVGEDAVVFAEWPEGLGAVLPAARLRVELEHLGGDRRLVRFSAADPESLAVVRSLVADSRPGHLDGQSQSGPDGGR